MPHSFWPDLHISLITRYYDTSILHSKHAYLFPQGGCLTFDVSIHPWDYKNHTRDLKYNITIENTHLTNPRRGLSHSKWQIKSLQWNKWVRCQKWGQYILDLGVRDGYYDVGCSSIDTLFSPDFALYATWMILMILLR